MLADPHARRDRVTDHDDPEQVTTAADLATGPGGLGQPLDRTTHPSALEHDDRQEGEHPGPAQLIG